MIWFGKSFIKFCKSFINLIKLVSTRTCSSARVRAQQEQEPRDVEHLQDTQHDQKYDRSFLISIIQLISILFQPWSRPAPLARPTLSGSRPG